MEIKDIMELIANGCFPILMCFMLYKKIDKQDEQHAKETDALSKAIENNTIALVKLTENLKK